ncbi:MAG: SDR family NAD(P)-dependent oxidoreductase [Erysipelotrichaceae bacterium]|nr:SDR family NAD(P)-dependent oxidoreductase [Erysipelotrichaceae bacterium]
MQYVLITGASSGIGKSLKDIFLQNNYHVIALDIKEIDPQDNLDSFICDITNKESLQNVKNTLDKQNIKLEYIINVAGIHMMASLVESPLEQMQRLININLNGTMSVNRIFHSLLKEKGRIIIITSEVASFDPMPFNGLYNVSKTALDTYAQALRQELNLLNQKVITFRPGAVKTPLCDSSLTGTQNLVDSTILYKKQAGKFLKLVTMFMGKPLSPTKMAKFIYKKSIKKHPKLIYKKHQNIGLVLLSILPKRWQCAIIKGIL